jgi:hypothetical protein
MLTVLVNLWEDRGSEDGNGGYHGASRLAAEHSSRTSVQNFGWMLCCGDC